ncbi:MAG: phenylacetic acid degradation protein PaaN [Bacteroidia bacterium]|nr:phenylacetic acid degradation protein PaaN [Bacteroidia bacterium]MCF8445712.1 phenylacetic acid degradation protein PaaN [Bacteroidia bacterium]
MNTSNTLFEKHRATLDAALHALTVRNYYSPYPENPRAYAEDADAMAKNWISACMNNNYTSLDQTEANGWIGEEVSPFLQVGIGVKYPAFTPETLLKNGIVAQAAWSKTSTEQRTGILIEALDRIKSRFFDIAYATMHTTGQSYMMSFQASGPHANDRALEAVVMGYKELTSVPEKAEWIKNLGKFDLKMNKTWKAIPKGISLVIGCSTFPVWNTVPGLFASLITGNATIVKPHPKAILAIAIVVEELQKVMVENGLPKQVVQLGVDTLENPITKVLAENPMVKMVDFTGGSEFGNYIESLPKTTFTEKAGVNSIILDSAKDLKAVLGNIAFSTSLYSGQMCTAPQNIFVSKHGVQTEEGIVAYEDVVKGIAAAITGLVDNPKAGPGTLGAIQAEATFARVQEAKNLGGNLILDSKSIVNEEFKDARIATPVVIELEKNQSDIFNRECFGPVVFVIKTDGLADSLALAEALVKEKGALTCGAYTTDETTKAMIAETMNNAFVPVSFNFTGAGFINSHAAFSDFHLTGGNPAGNASFANSEFVSKRFVWVGNREM